MPSFSYLTDNEINALIGYLDVLADVPEAGKTATVTEPATRIGELLVKGTCHICHDATGTWPDPEALLQGSIPDLRIHGEKKHARVHLESAPRRSSRDGFAAVAVPRPNAGLRPPE